MTEPAVHADRLAGAAVPDPGAETPPPVSVIIPFHRGLHRLDRVVTALERVNGIDEIIVVANGSDEDLSVLAGNRRTRILRLPEACGPARARNHGAAAATGEVLAFVDADVVPHPSAIPTMVAVLGRERDVVAVFGAYDHDPVDPRFYSQYRNLAHAFVHEQASPAQRTFWAGLGAIRRSAFVEVHGFDERFTRASIEDIDLGYRLTAAGHRLRLDTAIRGTHLRGWSLRSSMVTDVRDRGVPWTQALIKYGSIARDRQLNISWRGRTSVVLSSLVWFSLSIAPAWPPAVGIAVGAMTGFVWSEWPLLARFVQLRGRPFAAGVVGGQLLHHTLNGVSVLLGSGLWIAQRFGWRTRWTLPAQAWGPAGDDLKAGGGAPTSSPKRRAR